MKQNEIILARHFDVLRVKGLLFDVDGTLSDTDDRLIHRISKYLAPIARLHKEQGAHHLARTLVMAMETPANTIYHLFDRVHLDQPLSKIYDWLSRKRNKKKSMQDRFWIIPGVKNMLDDFDGRMRMAVVSARDKDTTHQFLEHFELQQYFDVVVTAQTCNHTKPFPDPVIFAAEQIGLEPAQCVMIGDTIVDVKAGKSAGAQTIAVLCGFGSRRELERAGADLIVESTTDIQELFAL
ncbi:MAG TPA: HAD-IA family hydrolase [Brevefilum fermentans]|jgi:HAD superfamily hydrolase (TIGR01549 family)|nr:HAD-IA family hydrolase [Brevefilum fermentans]